MSEKYYTVKFRAKDGKFYTEHYVPKDYNGFTEPSFIHRCEDPQHEAFEKMLALTRADIWNLSIESNNL